MFQIHVGHVCQKNHSEAFGLTKASSDTSSSGSDDETSKTDDVDASFSSSSSQPSDVDDESESESSSSSEGRIGYENLTEAKQSLTLGINLQV